jgi:hypothetical protein
LARHQHSGGAKKSGLGDYRLATGEVYFHLNREEAGWVLNLNLHARAGIVQSSLRVIKALKEAGLSPRLNEARVE